MPVGRGWLFSDLAGVEVFELETNRQQGWDNFCGMPASRRGAAGCSPGSLQLWARVLMAGVSWLVMSAVLLALASDLLFCSAFCQLHPEAGMCFQEKGSWL